MDNCEWGQYCFDDVDMSLWHTACHEAFTFVDESPEDNGMRFCCYCSKPISVHGYVDSKEETEEL